MPFCAVWRSRSFLSQLPLALLAAASLSLCLTAARPAGADPKSVLPAPVKGWKQLGATKSYTPANLFDLVDGEAQAIQKYAFVACAHAEYAPASANAPVLTIDVYDMTDPLNAYGLFGSDRRSGKPVKIGTEGVKIEPSGINFWKGRYVVRTAIVKVDPANQAAQEAFARAAAAKITGASAAPALISLLPPGYKPLSQNYIRTDIAGQTYLKNGVTAQYPVAGPQAELYVVAFPAPAAAKQAYTQYQTYLSDPKNAAVGAKPAPVKGTGDSAIGVRSKFSGFVLAALKGKNIVIVRKAKDPASAETLAKAALGRAK